MADAEDDTTHDDDGDGGGYWTWLLPMLAFLAGAALSGAVFLLGTSGGELSDDAAEVLESRPPSPSPSLPPGELVLQVPASCVETAELAENVIGTVTDAAEAARALDARRLQEVLDVVQELRPEVEQSARECRDIAADAQIVTPAPTSAATPSPTPVPTPSA